MATGVVGRVEATTDGRTEEHRRYNRAYMRRWRADPRHRDRERANRENCQYLRKLRDLAQGNPMCGFCHQRPPRSKVVRLSPVPRGYVKVLVPYCGQC